MSCSIYFLVSDFREIKRQYQRYYLAESAFVYLSYFSFLMLEFLSNEVI